MDIWTGPLVHDATTSAWITKAEALAAIEQARREEREAIRQTMRQIRYNHKLYDDVDAGVVFDLADAAIRARGEGE